jgi:hypothetical protein
MDFYNKVLVKIEIVIGGGSTSDVQLMDLCNKLFGQRFKGIYAFDDTFELKHGELAIFNLDTKKQPGSHWCAVVKDRKHYIVYDSFGRDIKLKQKNTLNTEDDPEQNINESNCGQRSVAWLVVVAVKGIKTALTI